jgi:hypothetical protein
LLKAAWPQTPWPEMLELEVGLDRRCCQDRMLPPIACLHLRCAAARQRANRCARLRAALRTVIAWRHQVYGSVIGMFEQNNLALNVPCPAEVYFGALQDEALVPDAAERAALEQKVGRSCGKA